jgi:hypothetical protein
LTAILNRPLGITTDGSALYFTEGTGNKIRKVVPASGSLADMTQATAMVVTLTGDANVVGATGALDGLGTSATFYSPQGITTDGSSLYVADTNNNKIRKIAPISGTLAAMTNATAVVSSLTGLAGTTVLHGATDGTGTVARMWGPMDITTDGIGLYVVDSGNFKIRKITPISGTLADMTSATAIVSSLTGIADTRAGRGAIDGIGTGAQFDSYMGIATDGASLYVVDSENYKIRKIAPVSGTLANMTNSTAIVSSLTGQTSTSSTSARPGQDGAGATATFGAPSYIAASADALFVTDADNGTVRVIH